MSTPAEEYLLQPVPPSLARWIGLACLLIGAALLGLCAFYAFKLVFGNAALSLRAAMLFALIGLLGGFFLLIGRRLLLRAAARSGSLLSPQAWMLLCVLFAAGTLGALWRMSQSPSVDGVRAVLMSALLSLLCYGASRHFGRSGGKRAL